MADGAGPLTAEPLPAATRWEAIRKALCPHCFRGHIFRGWIAVHERCPTCGIRLQREPGYFVGAMYISYGLSLPPGFLLLFIFWLWLDWPFFQAGGTAFLLYVPLVPFLVRFSRVLWLHFDRTVDPYD
jgi:uncharacterized protein (DUF983 family)